MKAPLPTRWHTPLAPGAGHCPQGCPDWLPALQASATKWALLAMPFSQTLRLCLSTGITSTHNSHLTSFRQICCMCLFQTMAQYLQTGLLWGQVGAPADCAQLQGRHGAADVQVLPCWACGLHQGDAVRAAHSLSWVLSGKEIQSRLCL